MWPRLAPLLLLGTALGGFVPGGCCGSLSHSLCYFYLQVSEPSQGLPQFFIRGCLDDQSITRYNSLTRTMEPLVPWMEEVERKTFLAPERVFRADLQRLSELNPQAGGLHIWQAILGCEQNGSKGGFFHYGYNGTDFISFNKETLKWVAAQPQAEKVKEKWDDDLLWSQRNKDFLEKSCIAWLHRYLSRRREPLQRTEAPVVTVSSRTEADDGMETHVCRMDGFYPKEIDASWRRDGEVRLQDCGSVAPNADGTYHYWLSIRIDPKERDHYRCHVEHDGLQEPLAVAVKVPESNLGVIVGCVVAAVVLVIIGIVWILVYRKKRQEGYRKATLISDNGSVSTEIETAV